VRETVIGPLYIGSNMLLLVGSVFVRLATSGGKTFILRNGYGCNGVSNGRSFDTCACGFE
jgi:hypothetical protein